MRPPAWREEARRLSREEGLGVLDLMARFDKDRRTVCQALQGPTPSEIRRRSEPDPATWEPEAQRLRTEEGLSIRQIADRIGQGDKRVRRAVRGLPIPKPAKPAKPARLLPAGRSRRSTLVGGLIYTGNSRAMGEDPKRERLHRLMSSDRNNRPPPPVTLARISLQHIEIQDA